MSYTVFYLFLFVGHCGVAVEHVLQNRQGVIGIAGPYSFIPDWAVTEAVFGPKENYPLMDALNYVDGDEPSTLLLHSSSDEQVGKYNQEKMAAALKDKGVDTEAILYEKPGHIDMVTHLHPWFAKKIN